MYIGNTFVQDCMYFKHTLLLCAVVWRQQYAVQHSDNYLCGVSAVDNDLMTPSFKLKRPQLQKHYQKQIDEMYKEAKKGL